MCILSDVGMLHIAQECNMTLVRHEHNVYTSTYVRMHVHIVQGTTKKCYRKSAILFVFMLHCIDVYCISCARGSCHRVMLRINFPSTCLYFNGFRVFYGLGHGMNDYLFTQLEFCNI